MNSIGNRSWWAIIISILVVAGIFLTTRADVAAKSSSSVVGLVSLKAIARQSVPYHTALSDHKPTLIEFYADWCTTCQSMAPTLSNLHQQYGETVHFVMLNIDDPQWVQPIKKYEVTGVPQLTFLNRDQEVVQTFVGKVPGTVLQKTFAEISS